jgi:hypothetical protein
MDKIMDNEFVDFLSQNIQKKEDLIKKYNQTLQELEATNQLIFNLKNLINVFFDKNKIEIHAVTRKRKIPDLNSKTNFVSFFISFKDKSDKTSKEINDFSLIIAFLKKHNFSLEIIEAAHRIELAKNSILHKKPALVYDLTNMRALLASFEEKEKLLKSSKWYLETGF